MAAFVGMRSRDLLRGEGAFHYRRDSVAAPAATPSAAPPRTRRREREDPLLRGAEEALLAVLNPDFSPKNSVESDYLL